MTLFSNRYLFSIEEYYRMWEEKILPHDRRYELIAGNIITMSPINSSHACVVNILNRKLNRSISEELAFIRIQHPVRLMNHSEPEPDLAIVKNHEHQYRAAHPTEEDIHFLIEVADSSLSYDQNIKTGLYAEVGIPEYWIVNIQEQQIEVYTEIKDKLYSKKEIYKGGQSLKSNQLPFELKVADLFA